MNTEAAGSAVKQAEAVEGDGLLDQIVEQSRVAKSGAEHQRAKDIISELAREVMSGTVVVSDNLNRTSTPAADRSSPRCSSGRW